MSTFHKSDGKIHLVGSTQIQELLKNNDELPEDSFMILSLGQLINRYQLWKQHLPRVKPFYAVKCNDEKLILKTLVALGVGFDCASEFELLKVNDLGVSPKDVIFAHPTKQGLHIRTASRLGVSKMTFDNKDELKKIKDIYPEAELLIRLRYDAKQSLCNLGLKFGAEFGDAVGLILTAKRLELNVIGLAFHLGTDMKDVEMFGNAIKSASTFFEVAKEIGYDFSVLDIGGGFSGTFDENGPSMHQFGQVINEALDQYFPVDMGIEIIAEPGRYFATPTCTLVTRIHSIRKLKTRHYMYFINDGIYGSFNCVYRGSTSMTPECLKETEGQEFFDSSISGPSCDSADKPFSNILFPALEVGDRIFCRNAGAYVYTLGGTFNGFPLPKIVHVADPLEWSTLRNILPLEDFEELSTPVKGIEFENKIGDKKIHAFVSDLLGSLPSGLYT